MMENLFYVYLSFIFLIVLVINMLTPNFTRKEIVFGVRVPGNKIDSPEIKGIKGRFIKNNLIIGVPFILLFSFLNYKFTNVTVILITVFAFVFINFLVYMISNREVKVLKLKNSWFKGKKQVVAVDVSYSRDKGKNLVPLRLFLIPLSIILINIILGYVNYAALPHRVPTHWDFSGNIDGYQLKSRFLIWEIPLFQMASTFMFFIICKIIGWSRQQLNVSDPEISVKKDMRFRRVWSVYMVIFAAAMNLLLTFGTIQIFGVFRVSNLLVGILTVAFAGFMILITMVLSIRIGQGGSNLDIGKDSFGKTESEVIDKDDDSFWKLANTIYYNPDDPSLFVEKRFGVGWTINAGRPAGMAVYIGMIALLVIIVIVAKNTAP